MARRKKRLVENVTITGVADKGMSVGRSPEGEVIFINGTVPGDVADILVIRKRKKVSIGVVSKMISLSPHRVEPFCKHFDDCGGCKWQNLSYEEQKRHKFITVQNAMTRLAKLDESLIEPILGSKETVYYRNKLEYSFSDKRYIPQAEVDESGEIPKAPALGFHVAGAWDKILDIDECFLQTDLSNDIRNFIRSFCLKHQFSFYNPRTHEGFMRNIIIRNTLKGDWMLIVIVSKDDPKKIKKIMEAVGDELPFITSLNYVINGKLNDVIYDLEVHNYKGLPYIVELLGKVEYRIGPKSFFQTNSFQAKELFNVVVDFADFKGTENVYDLYTGIGSIALYIADKVKHVTGIEEIEPAIEDAKVNALHNNIINSTFYAGDVKDILTDDFAQLHGKPDIVITDPPRAGMHEAVCKTLLALESPKIVYVSCNPATQARDLVLLSEKYDVVRIKPVDMFPHTHHIENVALLKLKA